MSLTFHNPEGDPLQPLGDDLTRELHRTNAADLLAFFHKNDPVFPALSPQTLWIAPFSEARLEEKDLRSSLAHQALADSNNASYFSESIFRLPGSEIFPVLEDLPWLFNHAHEGDRCRILADTVNLLTGTYVKLLDGAEVPSLTLSFAARLVDTYRLLLDRDQSSPTIQHAQLLTFLSFKHLEWSFTHHHLNTGQLAPETYESVTKAIEDLPLWNSRFGPALIPLRQDTHPLPESNIPADSRDILRSYSQGYGEYEEMIMAEDESEIENLDEQLAANRVIDQLTAEEAWTDPTGCLLRTAQDRRIFELYFDWILEPRVLIEDVLEPLKLTENDTLAIRPSEAYSWLQRVRREAGTAVSPAEAFTEVRDYFERLTENRGLRPFDVYLDIADKKRDVKDRKVNTLMNAVVDYVRSSSAKVVVLPDFDGGTNLDSVEVPQISSEGRVVIAHLFGKHPLSTTYKVEGKESEVLEIGISHLGRDEGAFCLLSEALYERAKMNPVIGISGDTLLELAGDDHWTANDFAMSLGLFCPKTSDGQSDRSPLRLSSTEPAPHNLYGADYFLVYPEPDKGDDDVEVEVPSDPAKNPLVMA